MKRIYRWLYPILIATVLIGFFIQTVKNREQQTELRQLRSALATYESKEVNDAERLNKLREERQDVIDRMIAAYKDNVTLKSENKRLSKTVEELYLRNVFNLQQLFGTTYETRISPELDRRVLGTLQQYMDAVSLEHAEGHKQLLSSEDIRDRDPFWHNRKGLIAFLLVDRASDEHRRQAEQQADLTGDFVAIRLFGLTKDYEVISATILMQSSGNSYQIIWMEQHDAYNNEKR